MLQKIIEAIKAFFDAIFGGGNKPAPKPTTITTPENKPKPTNPIPPQDGAETPEDEEIISIDTNEEVIVDPTEPDREFDPESKEEDVIIDQEDAKADVSKDPDAGEQNIPDDTSHVPRYMWCLDNGHGSKTAGKRSPLFTLDGEEVQFFEYEFNRDVVARIMKALDEAGVQYYNIVPEIDVDNILSTRVERANKLQSRLPKVYLSIHSNAGPALSPQDWCNDQIRGIETWFYHNSKRGQKVASIFQKHLIAETGLSDRGLKSKARGQFYVIRKTTMTAVLTENGFYNNRLEAPLLMDDKMRQKIADAHVKAILEMEANGI